MKHTSINSDLYNQADKWASANFANPGKAFVSGMGNNSRRAVFTVVADSYIYGRDEFRFEVQIRGGQLVFPDLAEHFGTAGA